MGEGWNGSLSHGLHKEPQHQAFGRILEAMVSRAWDRRRSKPDSFPHPTRTKLILMGPKGPGKRRREGEGERGENITFDFWYCHTVTHQYVFNP